MYSRPPSRDLRVPHNYGGSIFDRRSPQSTPVQDLTRRRQAPPQYVEPIPEEQPPEEEITERNTEEQSPPQQASVPQTSEKPSGSILSPLGALGTEELLLIALALIIFQGGKEPELALILLALLFIN